MRTYYFDFAQVLGCTMTERFESLLNVLIEANKDCQFQFVVGSLGVISLFEVASAGHNHPDCEITIGPLTFAGSRNCYRNQEGKMILPVFQIFKSNYIAQNELLLCGMGGNATVKFLNFFE